MKRGDPGSGGVAIMMKKELGKIDFIKKKRIDGLMWTKIECEGRIIYIATVYMVPQGSPYYENNNVIREQLEEDIGAYKKDGLVIVLGDSNSRI